MAGERRLSCAQAAAQQLQPPKLNETGSLELVKSLLRMVIYQIVHARGMFPASSFRKCRLPYLEGLEVQMLLPLCPHAKQLIAWIEQGVCDALKLGYLGSLRFGVSASEDASDALEEFELVFKYSDSGDCTFDFLHVGGGPAEAAEGDASAAKQAPAAGSVDSVKHQVASIIRKLIVTCHTLAPLPTKRCIYMKLVYNDTCPDSYQPAHFRDFTAVDDELLAQKVCESGVSVAIGSFVTEHHAVKLGVASLMDQFPDSQEHLATADVMAEVLEEQEDALGAQPSPAVGPLTMQSACPSACTSDITRDTIMEDSLGQVEAYCKSCPGGEQSISVAALLLAFPEISEPSMQILVSLLCDRRVLQPTGQAGHADEYDIVLDEDTIPPTQPLTSAVDQAALEGQPSQRAEGMEAPGGGQADGATPGSNHPKDTADGGTLASPPQLATDCHKICTESMDLAVLLAKQQPAPDEDERCDEQRAPGTAPGADGGPDSMAEDTPGDTQAATPHDSPPKTRSRRSKRRHKSSVAQLPIAPPKRMCTRSMSQPEPAAERHHAAAQRSWKADFVWPMSGATRSL